MTGQVLDVVLVGLLLLYAVTGYRQGILLGALSLIGFLGGGALGMWLLPPLLQNVDWVTQHEAVRVIVLVFLVFMAASVGQAAAVPIGRQLRSSVHARSGRALDAVLGAV
ncbi:MAG: CvpA family protein, partial [Actinomycetota bacterium]|nr:CvpA family protein [Actinomycetota bacterium]